MGLTDQEAAECAVGISKARQQIVRDVLQGLAAEIVAPPEVELDEGSRLAPGRRRPRLDVEARFLRALQENAVAARMIDLHRDQISRGRKAWDGLAVNVERLRR